MGLNAAAKKLTKAYEARFGATPNNQAAQVWDAFHMAAAAMDKAGDHNPATISRAMQSTNYAGICDYAAGDNNVLARSIYVYAYKDDGSKKLMKSYEVPFISSNALATTAPPTTLAPG